ncbi:MAG TPA: hypothetical protein VFD85_09950 [Gemmatimonadales bacterium]|nr:hypothetical protein [Gemmatimonadales bacterium]HZH41324.1 hypothetical protein [Gemmatimonadales bacterium]
MRRIGVLAGLALAVSAPLSAQCNTDCQRAEDALKSFHPVAGLIVSGGNPVLGSGGTLGGLGHFFVSARVNAVKVALPSTSSTDTAATSAVVPAPVVEAGVGVWNGLGGGLLAVDALVSATLLPTTQVSNLTVDPNATKIGKLALGLGYGARIGILKGSFFVPSVSVSVMRRTLPRLQYGTLGAVASTDSAFSFDTDLQATNFRVTAGLHLLLLDVAAGVGYDIYTSNAHIAYYTSPVTVAHDTLNLNNKREVVFLNAGMNLMLVKIIGEIGYQTGKDQTLSTNYQGLDPKAGHVFGGVGVRISF